MEGEGYGVRRGTGCPGNDRGVAGSAAGFLWCVGAGLCPARGRPQGSPLRRVARSAVRRADVGIGPYESVTRSAVSGPPGKSAKRCQWQMKRAGFEEVPRLAATTVAANRLARRWATAGPYGSITRGAMGGRPQGSPLRRVTRGAVKESPSHGFAVPAPFRQGGRGDGGGGLPQPVCAPASQ